MTLLGGSYQFQRWKIAGSWALRPGRIAVVDCSHAPPKRKKTKNKPKKLEITRKLARRPKKSVNKKQSIKKTSSKASTARKRRIPVRRAQQLESSSASVGTFSSRQSGDLEGLSRAEQANSESVGELVEEGNFFEAGAVAGVEEADDQDSREVHTHEVAEDDVPDEYFDKD